MKMTFLQKAEASESASFQKSLVRKANFRIQN